VLGYLVGRFRLELLKDPLRLGFRRAHRRYGGGVRSQSGEGGLEIVVDGSRALSPCQCLAASTYGGTRAAAATSAIQATSVVSWQRPPEVQPQR
jgi:hypothetical protein